MFGYDLHRAIRGALSLVLAPAALVAGCAVDAGGNTTSTDNLTAGLANVIVEVPKAFDEEHPVQGAALDASIGLPWVIVQRCRDLDLCITGEGTGRAWNLDSWDAAAWGARLPNSLDPNSSAKKIDGLATNAEEGYPFLITRGFGDKDLDRGAMVMYPASLVGDHTWQPGKFVPDTYTGVSDITTAVPAESGMAPVVPTPEESVAGPAYVDGQIGNLSTCFLADQEGHVGPQNWINEYACVQTDAALCQATTDPRAVAEDGTPIWVHASVHGPVTPYENKTIFGMKAWFHMMERYVDGEFMDSQIVFIGAGADERYCPEDEIIEG